MGHDMRIIELRLENFRGIKELDIDLYGKDANIFGANGTGKTTVANAIIWLLTDQAVTGEKDFTPKTAGTHDLHHKATMTVQVIAPPCSDCETIIIMKDFHEVWKKKRGSATPEFSGHETTYAVNGVGVKKKDYDATIERICGTKSDKIKMLTILGYFAETLGKDERRKILFDICGDVSDEEVIKASHLERLNDILKMPGAVDQKYSIDEYRKIAAEQRRKLNKQLEFIPERIDELRKQLPDPAQVMELQEKLKELNKLREEWLELREGSEKQGMALDAAILGFESSIEKGRKLYLSKVNKANEEAYKILHAIEFHRYDFTASKEELERKRSDIEKKIAGVEQARQELLKEYAAVQARQWDEGKAVCPTCHRPLPEEQVEALMADFQQRKSEDKKRINEKGKKTCSKEMVESMQQEAALCTQRIKSIEDELQKTRQDIEAAKARIQQPAPYEESERYLADKARIDELKKKKEAMFSDKLDDGSEEMRTKIRTLEDEIASLRGAESIKGRIEELEKEQRDTSEKLEQTEEGIHYCEEFIRAKVRMVTSKINSKFHNVTWLLFKDQINGGLKEVCEPMIPGRDGEPVEYKMANTAGQVNAGLEIIEVLNQHYGTSLPVIMDRAESVVKPIKIHEQLIRLIVSAPDDTLRIKTHEEE